MKTTVKPRQLKDVTPAFVTAHSKESIEPLWVLNIRLEAFNNYLQLPWPTKKDERWKRTQLEKLRWDGLKFSPVIPAVFKSTDELTKSLKDLGAIEEENGQAPGRYFLDLGHGHASHLPESLQEKSVEWISLEAAIKTQQNRIEPAWIKAVNQAKNNKFLSLTLALANTGSCLIIPKGQVIKPPLHHYLSHDKKENAHFALQFIFLDEAAEAHIWEELVGIENTSGYVSTYLTVNLKENAKASCTYLQQWNNETTHFQFQDVSQGAFSRYNAIAVSLGGRVFHNEKTVHLHGQGAENKVLGVLFGDGNQNFVNWITQKHTAPRTTSDIQFRGALKGSAHSFFSGMVYIDKQAQKSDAYQAAKSLLLSNEARADAIPNLEILADDVRCSHGAAVGPVDQEQKYYLQTRGIPPAQAEEVIVQGFLEPVIAEVPSPVIQDKLRGFIERKLHKS